VNAGGLRGDGKKVAAVVVFLNGLAAHELFKDGASPVGLFAITSAVDGLSDFFDGHMSASCISEHLEHCVVHVG